MTMATSVVVATARMPAVTSDRSSAITSDQSVPAIGCARNSLVTPSTAIATGSLALCRLARRSGVSSGDSCTAGFMIRSVFAPAMRRPPRSTRNAKLAGVGCIDATIALARSM